MTDTHPEPSGPGSPDDARTDQDADPDSLQPREPVQGRDGAAQDAQDAQAAGDPDADPDADPESLNPRDPDHRGA